MAALAFSGMGIEICGVEPNEAGGVKVFVGPRYMGRYFVVRDPDEVEHVRSRWAGSFRGHLIIDRRDVPRLLTEYRRGR